MHTKPDEMDRLVTHIAEALVDRPNDVEVQSIEGGHTMVLELRVAKEDVGKVIGRHGRTADAIRILVSAVSSKINKRAILEIIE